MQTQDAPENKTLYTGGCHCKKVRFSVMVPDEIVVWRCNCSICKMRKNYHFIVPQEDMISIEGKDNLSLYTFNTHVAQHYFCKTCGITSYYIPRCAPNQYGITLDCLDQEKRPPNVEFKDFDGDNWEKFYLEYSNLAKK